MKTLWKKVFNKSFPVDAIYLDQRDDKIIMSVRFGDQGKKGAVFGMALTDHDIDTLIIALLNTKDTNQ